MHLTFRKSCRVCGSTALTPVINLGDQYLQGSFVKPGKEMPPMRKIPLSLVRCDPTKDEKACGLLQMEHTVPPEVLYSAYWYRSGTNNTMKNHLKGIAEEAVSMLNTSALQSLILGAMMEHCLISTRKDSENTGSTLPMLLRRSTNRRRQSFRIFSHRMSF